MRPDLIERRRRQEERDARGAQRWEGAKFAFKREADKVLATTPQPPSVADKLDTLAKRVIRRYMQGERA